MDDEVSDFEQPSADHPKASSICPIDKKSVHRICSGQVVLTLATAVKELLENSIDAGATIVDIKLKEYGRDSIEVTDNGSGVEAANFQGLTLKHHTSKLQDFADLISVETFGFRGEALSSLCALCDMCIITRHKVAAVATRLEFDHNGIITKKASVARQVGTTVSLQNLFYTLPVRHKEFQKNVKKEFVKMAQVLNSYCIISGHVKITCSNQTEKGNRSTVVATKGNQSLFENISNVFGPKQTQSLLEFKQKSPGTEEQTEFGLQSAETASLFSINGYVSKCDHGLGRSSTDRQFFFINGRPFDSNKLSKVVNEVYHQYNRHQYPFVVLAVTMKKDGVDVNVTPDKRQVFMEQEKLLLAIIKASLLAMYEPTTSILQMQLPPSKSAIGLSALGNFPPGLTRHQSLDKQNSMTSLMKLKRSFSSAFDRTGSTGDSEQAVSDYSGLGIKQRKLDSFVSSYVSSPTKHRELEQSDREKSELVNNFEKKEISSPIIIQEDKYSHATTEENSSEKSATILEKRFVLHKHVNTSPERLSKSETYESVQDREDSVQCAKRVKAVEDYVNNDLLYTELKQERVNLASLSCESNNLPQENDIDSEDAEFEQNLEKGSNKVSADRDIDFTKVKCDATGDHNFEDSVFVVKPIRSRQSNDMMLIDEHLEILATDADEERTEELNHQVDSLEKVTRHERSVPFSFSEMKKKFIRKGKLEKDQEGFCRAFRATISPTDNQAAEQELQKEIKKENFSQMEILGQFNQGFIITRLGQDLFIVDQHATDEKFNFETLQRDYVIQSQRLISPKNLELTSSSETILMDNVEVFTKNGFEFLVDETAPPNQRVKLTATPVSKNWSFGKEDIEEMIFMLTDSPGVTCRPSRVRAMFASRACRKSVMIGTTLNKAEMKKLVTHMGEIEQPWNCPHGRPTMRHLINLHMLPT